MADLDLAYASACDLNVAVRERRVSPVDLVRNSLERIDAVNGELNAFCFVYAEEALAKARQAEAVLNGRSSLGALHGIPVAFKDITPTRGKRTTLGSYVYEHNVPDEDAVIVEALSAAGAILVGKTTTPEFANGTFTESPLWGITRNPWNRDRTPGGSSGGSAVAVATGCVPLAEGSDMGGSVRIPAACCGIVGLKPSFGRIPFTILPSQFDSICHIGPLARTVDDAALFLSVAQGPDDRDIQTLSPRLNVPLPVDPDIRGLRLAYSADLGYYAVDEEIAANTQAAVSRLHELGVSVEAVDLAWTRAINDAWYKHWCVFHALFFGQHLEGWRDRMDPTVVMLIEEGRKISALEYKSFEVVRTEQWKKLNPILSRYDALVCPTLRIPVPRTGMTEFDFVGDDEGGRFLGMDLTLPFNYVSQCPVLSVPSGFSSDGLPTGLQIVGRRYDDLTVLRIGKALEQVLGWPHWRPPV